MAQVPSVDALRTETNGTLCDKGIVDRAAGDLNPGCLPYRRHIGIRVQTDEPEMGKDNINALDRSIR